LGVVVVVVVVVVVLVEPLFKMKKVVIEGEDEY